MLAGIGIKVSGAFCASANMASEYIASTTSMSASIDSQQKESGRIVEVAVRCNGRRGQLESPLCSRGHLYDFLLNGESDQLRFVMDVEFAHEIELVGFHGLYAQT